ncbi:S-adenosyl-L-methionine-dependent methyltransferase [Phascolomyces articulosus]|uniref:S-adenosyl-L-methionine-dependent methyltransferase n=1 Tax=Phascolomyces articulosus TaxID=60185 RepID=A0AAD5K4I1_9FUNG|nr:S-adenosyl-L-methionine-dependent methyltransferase [Phascolomyces articulosus]
MFEYAKSFIGSLWSGKRSLDDEDDNDTPDQKRIRSEDVSRDGEGETLHRIKVSNFNKNEWKKVKKYLLELGCKPMSKAPKWDYGIINASVKAKDEYNKRMEKLHNKKNGRKAQKPGAEDDTRTPAEKLADQVTPLYKLSYEEQLKKKNNKGVSVMAKLKGQLANIPKTDRTERAMKETEWSRTKGRLPCKMYDPVPSPDINGYRTKCEFTIGKDLDGKPTVGFLLGLYKLGITAVLDPKDCLNVPDKAKRVASYMQDYIRDSEYPVYDRVEKDGVWRTLMTKTQRTGEVMVVIQMKTTNLTEEQVDNEKKKLVEFWNGLKDKPEDERLDITTLLFQAWDGHSNGMTDKAPVEVLTGDGIVHEELLGCKFRISSSAFFQINTPAAEVLYTKCAEWCRINKDRKTTLLDLCCGTGTIGITMAKSVDRVIGIEMVPEAIEDAKLNASINNITNVTYYANKVEDRIDVIGDATNEDVVAVLDPPSCDSRQALGNFYTLCKASSKRVQGEAFRPSRAMTIDLFPHTDHCELMVEFVRGEYLKDLEQDEDAKAAEKLIQDKQKEVEEKEANGENENENENESKDDTSDAK